MDLTATLSGNPPYFVNSMYATQDVDYSTAVGTLVFTATANNDETLQTLSYSIVSETPTGAAHFTIDTATGIWFTMKY